MPNPGILQHIAQHIVAPAPKNILEWKAVKRQMTFIDFVNTFDRVERTKHIDLDTDHTHAVYQATGKGGNKKKAGQILGAERQMIHAIENLKKFILETYNIELIGEQTHFVHLCHLCAHNCSINANDKSKHTCTSTCHTYFGSASENTKDVKDTDKHNTQVQKTCPHCGYETKEWQLNGRHIPACHFNPQSHRYLTPVKDTRALKKYQNQGLGHKLIELELLINAHHNQRHC